MKTPIPVPLPRDLNRCRGEGQMVGTVCPRRDDCARFLSIAKDEQPLPAYHGICLNDNWVGHVPPDGFPGLENEQ